MQSEVTWKRSIRPATSTIYIRWVEKIISYRNIRKARYRSDWNSVESLVSIFSMRNQFTRKIIFLLPYKKLQNCFPLIFEVWKIKNLFLKVKHGKLRVVMTHFLRICVFHTLPHELINLTRSGYSFNFYFFIHHKQ